MQGLVEFVKTIGATRVMAMAAVAAALIGFFAFLILRVTAVPMTPLFTDLAFEDSSAIIRDLERQAIPYQTRNDGAIILVPKDAVTRLRMKLAESGLPKGGSVGYEIFDKSDALGATSFVQNINHLRALEGELARTIRSIDRVASARVHLVLPERPLVFPRAAGALRLDRAEAARIAGGAAGAGDSPSGGLGGERPEARPGLDRRRKRPAAGGRRRRQRCPVSAPAPTTARLTFERRMRENVENIVSSIVGPGRARVQLTADFDFNRITQTTDKFDPEGRVVRSSQTREETQASHEGKEGQVTVGNELPGAQQKPGEAAANKSDNRKSEEIVNYEISRTTKTEVIEGGRVNRISVAVLVDGTYAKNAGGDSVYTPREKEELDRIAALVRSAIGFDQKRGDQVEIVNLRFAELPQNLAAAPKGWLEHSGIHQGRHPARHRDAGDGPPRPGRAVLRDPPAGAPHHHARRAAGRHGPARRQRDRYRRRIAGSGRRDHHDRRSQCRDRRQRPECRDLQSHLGDDRHRQGAGSGARRIGEEGRRTRRPQSARDRRHHPPMAARAGIRITTWQPPPPKNSNREQLGSIVAGLASRQADAPRPSRELSGPERAAVLMLALGDEYGGKIWELLDDDELRQLSITHVDARHHRIRTGRGAAAGIRQPPVGDRRARWAITRRPNGCCSNILPADRVGGIMDEIRGPAGRNMWEKLSNVQEDVLANYLKNEYPQTIAVVLSKLRPEHAARVLSILPEDIALDVVNRMLRLEAIQKEVIDRVELTLRTEFMSNISKTRRRDSHEVMAEIFNNFDRQTETRFLTSLEEDNRDSAERIKALMFTFDDLIKLDAGSAQTLMRHIDKDKLAVALKGANEAVRQFFFSNMSSRAAKMLTDDMANLGPVRLNDVDDAQVLLVNLAKDLAAKGELVISKQRGDEELVY